MRVVLVERRFPNEPSRLDELSSLAQTLGHEVIATLEQVREPDPAYQIGEGKAEELARLVKVTGAGRVIFDNQLTPSQAFKLSRLTGVEVVDRFQLILEIFAKRAGSPEAKLQVEYARLSYELPRVREQIRTLMSVEQPGLRGRGEYEVNVYFDTIRRRMINLKRKLKSLVKTREQRRKLRRRRGFKLVALAGYTNAGKSTLLNALTEANVEVDEMLFTTLTARTRAIKTSKKILLTDPVGFIDGLPAWLVEAFKATLEEIYFADLVLLVIDGAEPIPEILRKLRVSREVLAECDVGTIIALNKIDMLSPEEIDRRIEVLSNFSRVVPISAKQKTNLNELLETIRENVLSSTAGQRPAA